MSRPIVEVPASDVGASTVSLTSIEQATASLFTEPSPIGQARATSW